MEVTEANIDSVISQLQEDMKWFEAVKKWNEQKRTVNTAHVWAMPRKGTTEHAEVAAIVSGKPQAAAAPVTAKAVPKRAAKTPAPATPSGPAAHVILKNGELYSYTDAHSGFGSSDVSKMRKVGDMFYGKVFLIAPGNEKDEQNHEGDYVGVRYDKSADKLVTSFHWGRHVRGKGVRMLPVESNMIVKPKGGFKMPVEISDAAKEYIKNASR